ncbi:MAG: right-handed parallel beta-helix repeat-containing protein [Myxococcota bacterium]
MRASRWAGAVAVVATACATSGDDGATGPLPSDDATADPGPDPGGDPGGDPAPGEDSGADDPGTAPPPCPVAIGDVGYAALGAAIDAASAGDVITVCAGTFVGTFTARVPLTVIGAGADQTVLDGGGAGTTLTLRGDSAVRGLTIRNGAGTAGGGIHAEGAGSLTVTDCVIADNTAGEGGGLWSSGLDLVLASTRFDGNEATETDGGGFLARSGTITATDVVVYRNVAIHEGGGWFGDEVDVVLDGTSVEENVANAGGGAWLSRGTLVGGTFARNVGGTGGGLSMWFADATGIVADGNIALAAGGGVFLDDQGALVDAVVTGNHSAVPGIGMGGGVAVMRLAGFGLAITGSTIEDNDAWLGGGISADGSATLTITDTTIRGNTGGLGGGLYASHDHRLELVEAVIEENVATTTGGGVYTSTGFGAITSEASDWGTPELGTDNTPNDVWIQQDTFSGFGAGATFTCDGGGCSPAR